MLQFEFSRDTRCSKLRKKNRMIFSTNKRCCAVFLIIFIVLIDIVSLEAKRSWGGRSSSSGSRSSSSSRWKPSSKIPMWTPKAPKPPSSVPHTSHSSDHSIKKESSNTLIHAEGGGRPRPGSSPVNDHKQQSTPHQPSAPIEPINRATSMNVQNQATPHGSSPGGSYPSWANPGASPHVGPYRNPPGPTSNFPSNPANSPKPTGPISSVPYPPIHPPGPISHQIITPTHHSSQTSSSPHQGSYPNPNAPHGMPAPYPPSVPYPGGHPPGMPMPNAPHIGFGNANHPTGSNQPIGSPQNYHPLNSAQSSGFPNAPPSSTIIHHHYNAPPPLGSPQNPAGHPHYVSQPSYGGYGGGPPMNQPFVPGQTTVFLPSQQSSGTGIGQLVKEALVFSTVNAGVNRLINGAPHHHDHYQPVQSVAPSVANSAPPASTSSVTNTVIYNNQYGPPNSEGSAFSGGSSVPGVSTGSVGTQLPGSLPSISQPISMPGNQPPFPGSPSMPGNNYSGGNGGSNPTLGTTSSGSSAPGGPFYPIPSSPSSSPSSSSVDNRPVNDPGYSTKTIGDRSANSTGNDAKNETMVSAFEYYIGNEELWNLTESLFRKDEYNASRFVTLNLQNLQTDVNVDVAPAQLLYVEREAHEIPTIKTLREIYDNFKFDSTKKESINAETRRKENALLDVFLDTNIMTATMSWLSQKGYIEPDSFEWKDTLRHIWMTKVNGATSGFERIFLAENYENTTILGAQNWIYIDDDQESAKRVNYMGYVNSTYLGQKCHLVKLNQKIDGIVKSNTTMLVGTPPELEMALYTICWYARPNDVCNVSLGGVKFNIYTHPFRYFGKDLIDLGLMFF